MKTTSGLALRWQCASLLSNYFDLFFHIIATWMWKTHTPPFNGLFFQATWVGRYQKDKPFWILLKQETTWWQWHQLNHMQIICTSLQTDNHASTSSLHWMWKIQTYSISFSKCLMDMLVWGFSVNFFITLSNKGFVIIICVMSHWTQYSYSGVVRIGLVCVAFCDRFMF